MAVYFLGISMAAAMIVTALLVRMLHRRMAVERRTARQLRESQAELQALTAKMSEVNRELQRLARVKDEFVAMVNHELRTPLTAMRHGVAMLLDGTLGPTTTEQQEYLRVVLRNMNQLHELIANLLDLSQLQAGKLTIHLRPCRLQSLVEESCQLMAPLLEQRTLQRDLPELPAVVADHRRLLQVLNNLLSNAIKFTQPNHLIRIHGSVKGTRVQLSISDNGGGIPLGYQQTQLFRRFERSEGEHARPGTGLGLAICRELVELQHGSIQIVSTPGNGTTVTVELPIAASTGPGTPRTRGRSHGEAN